MSGPLAPEVLDELERYLARVTRGQSAAQLAARVLQMALELRGHAKPPRDLALMLAANALILAEACADRDAANRKDKSAA